MSARHECELSAGRSLKLADSVQGKLSCGVVVLEPVSAHSNPAIWQMTRATGEQMVQQYAGQLPSEMAGLTEARKLYKSFGVDPSRTRPSSEALLRRVLKGHELYHINGLVDTCNLASLQFLLPIGMYDLALIQGDVTLKVGAEGDGYAGIRKGAVNLAGRLGLFDSQGPFGSPTSDSSRTSMSESTTSVLAVIMATATFDSSQMAAHVATFSQLFCDNCAGVEVFRTVLGGHQ